MTTVHSREDIELTGDELNEMLAEYLRSRDEMTEDEIITDIYGVEYRNENGTVTWTFDTEVVVLEESDEVPELE